MAHPDIVYLRHIVDAILRIREYLTGIDEMEFIRNNLVQDGVSGSWKSSVKLLSGSLRKLEK